MKILLDFLGIGGLILNMAGTILIIKSSPFKDVQPGISSMTFGDPSRTKKEKWGLKVLFCGFLLQFISAFGELFF